MGAGDVVMAEDDQEGLLARDVVVEEKLDGANVMLWLDDGIPHAATRGGAGSADRSGLLGPVRAWAMEHADALRAALGERYAVYGEWLLRRHAVPYDRLPAPFVAFDVLDRGTGVFAPVAERDVILQAAELAVVPRVFSGRLASLEQLRSLHGRSAFGEAPAEGLVVRAAGAPRMVAKLIDPRWSAVGNARWSTDPRSNALRPEIATTK